MDAVSQNFQWGVKMSEFYVHIVEYSTNKSVKTMGPHSENMADRIDSGVSINLDHERFYTIINEQPEYKEGE
jgi:hypothetical protein